MTDTLYRWVKASERNPPSHPDTKHNIRYIEGNGWGKDLKGVAKYVGRWVDDAHGSIDDKVIEWLEPYTPSPVSGSLEESAKDYANKIVPVMGVKHDRIISTREAVREDVQNAFMEGALRERANETEMKRLYDWIMDENRKGATTFFTSGWLRNVAKEIEYRIAVKGGGENRSTHEVLKDGDAKLTELKKDPNHITTQLSKDEHTSYNTGFHAGWCQSYVYYSLSRPSIDIVELKRAWNLAITIANNECMRMSDDWNNDDQTEEAHAANECAKRIRGYIDNPIPELLNQQK